MDLSFGRDGYFERCIRAKLLLSFVARRRFEGLKAKDSAMVGMSEFDVDKTMRLVDKLWSARGQVVSGCTGEQLPLQRDFNDKHGSRVAFPTFVPAGSDSTAAAIPVLRDIDILDRHLSPSAKLFARHSIATDWGEMTLLESQVGLGKISQLVAEGVISRSELELLERLGDAIAVLSEQNVIAIGRNESSEGSELALLWELNRWNQWVDTSLSAGISNVERAAAIWQACSFARECMLKSSVLPEVDGLASDRVAYRFARRHLTNVVAVHASVAALVERTHDPDEVIWESPAVSTLGFVSYAVWLFSSALGWAAIQCGLLRGTPYQSRVQSLVRGPIETYVEELGVCLSIEAETRPERFSIRWLRSIPITISPTPRDILLADRDQPSASWDQLETAFRAWHDVLFVRHLRPVLRRRDVQEV